MSSASVSPSRAIAFSPKRRTTGSGRTTLLGVLWGFISDEERLTTIEDAAELRLAKPHVVSLEA